MFQIELYAGAEAPELRHILPIILFVGKLQQKLRQTKLWKIISYYNELLVMEKLSWMILSY